LNIRGFPRRHIPSYPNTKLCHYLNPLASLAHKA
jgi:hypothetical protein